MDVGSAMHAYLQLVSLESVGTRSQLEAEAARLMEQKILTREEAGLLNFGHLERFWGSQLGQNVQAHRDSVVRELPFTFKLPLPLFSQLMARSAGTPNRAQVDSTRPDSVIDDFIVVQGVADLVLLMPNEIQIIDFKTDRVTPEELSDRARLYEPQLKLYCLALSGIYRRPVSHCWLYFLTLAEPVEIASAQVTSHIQPESGSCFSPQ
jgi:ATP-dependent helicase/nuclease subunit A